MVRSQRRVRRRQRPARATLARSVLRKVQHSDIGCQFAPSLDPPAWAAAPWWPITVTSRVTKPSSFTGEVLHGLLLLGLNLGRFQEGTKKPQFNIRVLTVRAWGVNRQPITLDIYTGIGDHCRKIRQLNDMGNPIHYSRLGWRYGTSSFASLDTNCSESADAVFYVGGKVDTSNQVLVYVQLLVQLQGVPAANAKVSAAPGLEMAVDQMAGCALN